MNDLQPLVSIGLPVYNGENYLQKALDAILNQTFKDFEVIISDNASSDRTEKICRQYAVQDKRIIYHRQSKNLGAAPNYNFVFHQARGKYFKWLAHDDSCAERFLEQSVAILNEDRSIVLCHSKIKIIDREGRVMDRQNPLYQWVNTGKLKLNTNSDRASTRFREILSPHPCYQVFGLIRTDILKETGLIGSYSTSDRVLLAQLSLRGKFYELDEDLLYLRRHVEQSIHALQSHRSKHKYSHWFDTSTKTKIIFPRWRVIKELIISIENVSLSWSEKLQCYIALTPWLRRSRKGMLEDLAIAIQQVMGRFYQKLVSSS